ncbi:MAG: O-methyltransferase [Thermoplasmata archaeon]
MYSVSAAWDRIMFPRVVARDLESTLGAPPLGRFPHAWVRQREVTRRATELGWPPPEFHHRWFGESLYWLARTVRPRAIVETGVEKGLTSYFWLRALADNDYGTLHSIDLPTVGTTERVNADGRVDRSHVEEAGRTGALVPPSLRNRWELTLGDAKRELPALLSGLGSIDLFFHDSDHSYAHQLWEYRTAWPALRDGGLLTSDDVDWSDAFSDFSREVDRVPVYWPSTRPTRGLLRK